MQTRSSPDPLKLGCAQTAANRRGPACPPRGCPARPSRPLAARLGLLAAPRRPPAVRARRPKAKVTTQLCRRGGTNGPTPHPPPGGRGRGLLQSPSGSVLGAHRRRPARPCKPAGGPRTPASSQDRKARPAAPSPSGRPGSCRLRAAPLSGAGPRPQGRRPPAPRPSRPASPLCSASPPPSRQGLPRRAGRYRSPGAGGSAGP